MWAYVITKHFHDLGHLDITPERWPVWHTLDGRVALCQFRDNLLTAIDTAPRNRASCMVQARSTLKNSWNPQVVCSCITPLVTRCTAKCRTPVTKAIRVVMVLPGTNNQTGLQNQRHSAATGHLNEGRH